MPAIQTTCPGCRVRLRCPAATRAGKLILCPRCGTGFAFGWPPRSRQPPAGARRDWSADLVLVVGGLLVTLAVAAVGVTTLLLSGR